MTRCNLFRVTALLAMWAGDLISSPLFALDERASIEAAHEQLWGRFINRHGIIHDYVGLRGEVDLPTPEECRDDKPNALGWSTPIEDGAFFNGLYLDAICRRFHVTRAEIDSQRARRIADGLITLAEVGQTPGFIARGVASDGRSHYAASSSDQTYPWFYGMWRYARSGIPTEGERRKVVSLMMEVAKGLEANNWEMPIDKPGFGHFGHWTTGFSGTPGILVGAEPQFDAGVRYLFVLRALYDLTGDSSWLERYRLSLGERPVGSEKTRLEIASIGVDYVAPGEPAQFPERPRLWTSASTQAGLKALSEMETEPRIADEFKKGLRANGLRAAKFISGYRRYDNDNTLPFDIRWRSLNSIWKPQSGIADAVLLGRAQKGDGSIWQHQSPRFWTESVDMRDPLFSAWVVSLSTPEVTAASRDEIGSALTHYTWSRLYTGFFFMAECVYWQMQATE